MKNLLIILVFLILTSCGSEELSNEFFYNTERIFKGNICNGRKDEWTRTYSLDSSRIIYRCYKDYNTKFIITNDANINDIYEELEYPQTRIDPWVLTYDNKTIIGIKESPSSTEKMEIVSIDLATKKVKTLYSLPYYTYWFSKHPISENGILIFKTNYDNKAIVFDTNTGKLNKSIFTSNFPIISKDGKKSLIIDEEEVYSYDTESLFDTKNMRRDFIYSSKNEDRFKTIHAHFGADGQIIVSGVKNPNFKPLQQKQGRIIKDKKVLKKGEIDFSNGYRYY